MAALPDNAATLSAAPAERARRVAEARRGHGGHALRQQAAALRAHRRRVRARRRLRALPARPHRTHENVRFISGTDCFGSPINEGYRKPGRGRRVRRHHRGVRAAATTTRRRRRSTPTASACPSTRGRAWAMRATCTSSSASKFIEKLHENGHLHHSAPRCSSTTPRRAHVPERPPGDVAAAPCRAASPSTRTPTSATWGTSYAPCATLSSRRRRSRVACPSCARCANWYFDLPEPSANCLRERVADDLEADPERASRGVAGGQGVPGAAGRLHQERRARGRRGRAVESKLPVHELRDAAEGGKQSFELEFADIDAARRGARRARGRPESASARARRSCRSASRATWSGA